MLASCTNPCEECNGSDAQYLDSLYSCIEDTLVLQNVRDSLIQAGDMHTLIYVDHQLGRVLRNKSLFGMALYFHREQLQAAREMEDTLEMVRAYNCIGMDFRRLGSLPDAAISHFRALQMMDNYSDTESELARIGKVKALDGLGNVAMQAYDYDTADSLFRLALDTERDMGKDQDIAVNLSNLGAIFDARGQLDSARTYYLHSMHHNKLAKSQRGICLCHIYLGGIAEKEGNYDQAISEYQEACDIMADGVDEWHWLQAANALTRAYIKNNQLELAKFYLDTAWTVATQINSLENMSDLARLRYDYYSRIGDLPQALSNLEISETLSDSVANKATLVQIHNAFMRYMTGRAEGRMRQMQTQFGEERSSYRLRMWLFALALLLALSVLVVMALMQRVRNQKQRLLVAKYEARLKEQQSARVQELAKESQTAEPTEHNIKTPSAKLEGETQSSSNDTNASDSSKRSCGFGNFFDSNNSNNTDNAPFLAALSNCIVENMGDSSFGSAQLADKMCLSQRQLNRKVKMLTGLDCTQCIRTTRIARAKHLLRTTDLPILDIACKCGFETQTYFSRVFRQEEECTPTAYRSQHSTQG